MREPIRNIKQRVLAKGWTELCEYSYDYHHSNGQWIAQIRDVFKRGPAVAVLPYDQTRQTVLLTRQFRMPVYVSGHDPFMLEACAGVIDDDQTPQQTAVREAEEELGYHIVLQEKVFSGFSSPGNSSETVDLFLATYQSGDHITQGGGLINEGEDIAIIEMGVDDIFSLLDEGKINDLKTALLLAALRMKLACHKK